MSSPSCPAPVYCPRVWYYPFCPGALSKAFCPAVFYGLSCPGCPYMAKWKLRNKRKKNFFSNDLEVSVESCLIENPFFWHYWENFSKISVIFFAFRKLFWWKSKITFWEYEHEIFRFSSTLQRRQHSQAKPTTAVRIKTLTAFHRGVHKCDFVYIVANSLKKWERKYSSERLLFLKNISAIFLRGV
jgi:hypothetical protein